MKNSGTDTIDPSTIDTGEPIAALHGLEEAATSTFSERLRRRIHRRRLGADLGRLSWDGPIAVVVELLSLFFGMLGAGRADDQKEG